MRSEEEKGKCSREKVKLRKAQMGYENEEDIGMAACCKIKQLRLVEARRRVAGEVWEDGLWGAAEGDIIAGRY